MGKESVASCRVQGAFLARRIELDRIKGNSIHILPSLVSFHCLVPNYLPTFNISRVAGTAAPRGEKATNRRVDNSQQSEIGLAKKFPEG
jgi:hypothetical protein